MSKGLIDTMETNTVNIEIKSKSLLIKICKNINEKNIIIILHLILKN